MRTFVKIFKGCLYDVENDINEMARKRNLNIISVSSCTNMGSFYVTVVFSKQDGE